MITKCSLHTYFLVTKSC